MPRKDQCDFCTEYKVGNVTETEWKKHCDEKDAARKLMTGDIAVAKDKKQTVLFMDLEAVKASASLKLDGVAPIDGRGKHSNRPHKLSEDKVTNVKNHISSFKGSKAHYSLNKTSKVYLPEELSVKKMHEMYTEKNNFFYLFPTKPTDQFLLKTSKVHSNGYL